MTITLAQNAARVSYSVSEGATQTSFTVSFEFFDAADLNVYVDGTLKTISTHYTVSGGSGSTGAVAISVTGASGGSTVVITRSIALARTTDFPTSGSFQIATLNTELDRFTAIAADLKDSVDRSLQLTDFDTAVSLVLPAVADRKGKVLAFNASTGAVEAGASVSAVQSVADNAAAVNLLGTAAVVADLNILATDAAVADMAILATSAIVADMAILATDAIVADMAILATSDIVADMALLATDAIVADMALLATSAVIEDMGLLATAAVIEDMGQLANSTVLSNIATLASDNSPSVSAITVGGASQFNGTLTVGANDQGYDVKLFGDTASAHILWDASADKLLTAGGATIDIVKDKLLIGGTPVTTTAVELNYNNITTLGLSQASKVVTADANGVITLDNGFSEEYAEPTSSSNAMAIDLRTANNFSHTLTENTTISFAHPAASGKVSAFTLKIIQASSAKSVDWDGSIKWAGDSAPTISTGSGNVDVFTGYTVDGGTNYYMFTAGQVMS
jgi:hypothetical protein